MKFGAAMALMTESVVWFDSFKFPILQGHIYMLDLN